VKPFEQATLPIVCPTCKHVSHIAIAKLVSAVGIVCTACKKEIALSADFLKVIRQSQR